MSPASSRKHQKISGELFTSMHNYLRGKSCEVYSAPFDVRLNINNEEDKIKIGIFQALEINLNDIFAD